MMTKDPCHRNRLARLTTARRAFTFTEFTVSLVVFGVALSGLLPLVVIMSRDLQPLQAGASSPARDFSNSDCPVVERRPTIWYLTPSDDAWTRKLGAGARVSGTAPVSSTPLIQPPVVFLDDDGTVGPSGVTGVFTAGTASTLTPVSGLGYHNNYRFAETTTTEFIAMWQITAPADGWYAVQVTWPTTTGRPLANATYTVNAPHNTRPDGQPAPTLTLSPPLNQASPGTPAPDASGVTWWPITPPTNRCVKLVMNDIVTVTLSAAPPVQAGSFLIADAVRLVQNEVSVDSLERSADGKNSNSQGAVVSASGSVTVNICQ
jgi:hypothetical protein